MISCAGDRTFTGRRYASCMRHSRFHDYMNTYWEEEEGGYDRPPETAIYIRSDHKWAAAAVVLFNYFVSITGSVAHRVVVHHVAGRRGPLDVRQVRLPVLSDLAPQPAVPKRSQGPGRRVVRAVQQRRVHETGHSDLLGFDERENYIVEK